MKRVGHKTAKQTRTRRWMIVPLLLAFGAAIAVGGSFRQAQAQLDENLLELGARMMRYEDADTQRAPRDLVVNGQVLRISTGTVGRPMRAVLDVFERRCADADGELTEQLRDLQQAHGDEDEDISMLEAPILRTEGERQGYVACIDLGPTSVSVAELAERLQAYQRSGDVGEIGDARYVFAEQSGTGDEASTHFVALWTTGSFNLRRMFPEDGDAPGDDPEALPRPPEARRVLQGFERGQPHTMTVYETRVDEADLERFFERELAEHGWDVSVTPRQTGRDVPTTFVAERGGNTAVVVLNTNLRTGRASAAIFESR